MERDAPDVVSGGGSWTVGTCPVLVERDAQLKLLEQIAARAAGGEGQLAVVTGEAGAGKSRLTRELATGLGDPWRSVLARVEVGATSLLSDLVGEIGAGDAPAGAIGDALGRALARSANEAPVLVIVEDLERADPVLIAALASTLDAIRDAPVLVVAGFRLTGRGPAGERAAALADVLRAPQAHEVTVDSLSRAGVARMADAMNRSLSETDIDELNARAGGNPFFVEELLHAPAGTLPWTITEAVGQRLDALPSAAREVAEALACAFDPVPRHVVERVVDDGGRGSVALLNAAIAVVPEADQIALRHALISEVVGAQLTATARREWHRRLALALEDEPEVAAARLTRHWQEAGDADRAAQWAAIAGDEAARGRAYRTATELYRVALLRPPTDELAAAELLDRAAVAAASGGLGSDAFAWATEADARYRAAGEQWRAIAMWLNPALPYVPKPELDYRTLEPDAVPRLIVEAFEATRRTEYDHAIALARRAIELGDDRTDLGVLQIAAAARRLASAGRNGEGDEILARLRVRAAAAQNRPLLSRLAAQQSFLAAGRGDLAECLAFNRQALALSDDEQGVWGFESGMALILAYLGELDEATGMIERLFATGDPIVVEVTQLAACIVDLERADLAAAAARLERLQAVTSLGVADYTLGVLAARARWHQVCGRHDQTLTTVAEARQVSGDLFEPSRVESIVLAVRSAHALHDEPTFARERALLDRGAELGGGRVFAAAAAWARALDAARREDLETAAAGLVAAADEFEAASRFTRAAETWTDLVSIATAMGDPELRARAIRRATEIAQPRRLVSVLATLDAAAGGDGEAAADRAGPLRSLSGREREIALLVASGRTNREIASTLFVSEHTVRNQLVNVFAKLGISRRTELARLVPRDVDPRPSSGQPESP